MPARTEIGTQHVLTKPNHVDTQYISTCVEIKPPMHARTQNVLLNPFYASDYIKYISTSVDQTSSMQAMKQNGSQHVMNKPIPCQRGHKIYLNTCRPNAFHARLERKDSLHVLTKPLLCQHGHTFYFICVLTKPLPCRRGQKMYLNMC
jgi:hypothetical protein